MLRQLRPALFSVLIFTLLTGVVFPAIVTVLAQSLFPWQAHGSQIVDNDRVVGSAWIGQRFTRPEYFHPRPSAAGDGYDATASGGTNLGPTSRKLIDGVAEQARTYRRENGLPPQAPLPAEAVTSSASGLDPHISPENAAIQAARVARARGKEIATVQAMIAAHTEGQTLGVLGEPRVNVLSLNRALDALK
jgi:K+-transporting ATPase ATPase C chain